MKCAALVGVLAAVAAAAAQFQPIKMSFNIHRGDSVEDARPGNTARLVRRDSFTMVLENAQTFYLTEINVGSNGDAVRVLVDTGSSDLWVMSHQVSCFSNTNAKKRSLSAAAAFPKQRIVKKDDTPSRAESLLSVNGVAPSEVPLGPAGGGQSVVASATRGSGGSNTCTSYGSFDTGLSDSFSRNSSAPAFEIQYADGTTAEGVWGTDNVAVHNVTVSGLSFAVVNATSSNIGVFGIGLSGLETTYSSGGALNRYQYQNYPQKLVAEGIIQKNAYSLYLGEASDSTGTILFGAVDHAKYTGDLLTVPVVNSLVSWGYRSPIRLEINLSSITFNNSRNQVQITDSVYPALLDTGTTLTYVPQDVLEYMAELLSTQYSSSVGAYLIDCDALESTTRIKWSFSGVQITTPLSDFVLRVSRNTCVLGIFPQGSGDDYILLGDNFLRSAYVVYDLDDLTISLAQVNYTDDEDIEIISSSIPSAQAVSGAATAAGTGGPVASGTGSFSQGRSSSRSSATGSNDSEGSSRSASSSYRPHLAVALVSLVLSVCIV